MPAQVHPELVSRPGLLDYLGKQVWTSYTPAPRSKRIMGNDMTELRKQIQVNAKLMLRPMGEVTHSISDASRLPTQASDMTLINRVTASPFDSLGDIEAVVFGFGPEFTAAVSSRFQTCVVSTDNRSKVMVGVTPAMEGATASTPEGALRKLLIATCELLNTYMPKLGAHQRAIHGGGVYDEDLISSQLSNPQRKA